MSDRGMGRGLALYALGCVVAIGLAAGVLVAMYDSLPERRAVLVSALVERRFPTPVEPLFPKQPGVRVTGCSAQYVER